MDSIKWAINDLAVNERLAKMLMDEKVYKKYINTFESYDNTHFLSAYNGLQETPGNKNHSRVEHNTKRVEKTVIGSNMLKHEAMATVFNTIKYANTSEEVVLMDGHKTASSHFKLYWQIQEKANRIWFNFSIPKYLYGNNIAQFSINPQSPKYNVFEANNFDIQFKQMYAKLFRFFEFFIEQEFGKKCVNEQERRNLYKSIEIIEFDLCYNQYFESKDDALGYLDILKTYRQKNQRGLGITRENTKIHRETLDVLKYETGIAEVNKSTWTKIYHKGTEYAKKDKKEHNKINNKIKTRNRFSNKQKAPLIPIEMYQEEADKILRYEMRFKPKKINYIFNTKVFRKNCPIHEKNMRLFKKLDSLSKGGKELNKLTNDEKKKYKKLKSIKTKKRNYLLEVNPISYEAQKRAIPQIDRVEGLQEVFFSEELWGECVKQFKEFIEHFKLQQLDTFEEMKAKLHQYNKAVKNKKLSLNPEMLRQMKQREKVKYNLQEVKPKTMLGVFKLMQHYTFDQLIAEGLLEKDTVTRYRRLFEKLDINTKGVFKVFPFNPKTSFEDYYISVKQSFMHESGYGKEEIFAFAHDEVRMLF